MPSTVEEKLRGKGHWGRWCLGVEVGGRQGA